MEIQERLDQLYGIRNQIAKREEAKKQKMDEVLTPEIRKALSDIEAEFKVPGEILDRQALIEKEIRDAVLLIKDTVKGNHLMAVYSKGRTSWDTKALEGYCVDHPDLLKFKTTGDASISIRIIAEQK